MTGQGKPAAERSSRSNRGAAEGRRRGFRSPWSAPCLRELSFMRLPGSQLLASPLRRSSRPTQSDQTSCEAVLAGNRDLFGRLYQLYAPLVHGVLLSAPAAQQVEDMVQEIFCTRSGSCTRCVTRSAFGLDRNDRSQSRDGLSSPLARHQLKLRTTCGAVIQAAPGRKRFSTSSAHFRTLTARHWYCG